MSKIYSKIDVSSGGSLMGTVDKEALMKVSEDWLDSLATKEIALTQSELEALQEKIVKEDYMPTSEHFSLHIYESRWDIDGEKYILYKAIGYPDVEGFRIE